MGILLNSSIPVSLRCLLDAEDLPELPHAGSLRSAPTARGWGCHSELATPQEGELPILILQNDLLKAKQGGEEGVPPTSPAHHPASLRGINANRCSRCASGPERTANTCPSTPIPTHHVHHNHLKLQHSRTWSSPRPRAPPPSPSCRACHRDGRTSARKKIPPSRLRTPDENTHERSGSPKVSAKRDFAVKTPTHLQLEPTAAALQFRNPSRHPEVQF
ncbi:hypothetical protein Anapl_09386 [Anas platyrhynchos]|uniref:Uncharacterized protein n=1 Tax=Anas platyrhynchos TaxID=8839 RepID=R0LLM6_ANAPL|nr:hypothetical protein Anapl_09386 [Anas platyrhynchos]